MRASFLLLIATVLSVALCDFVIDLDASNFDAKIKENPVILVEFYAPWCGHCKRLAPEYEKAAEDLQGVAVLAKVNADEEQNRPLAQTYGVRGYPTVKLFRNGVPSDYEGDRTASDIVRFMKRQTRPAIETLADSDALDHSLESERVIVVGFFADKESAEYQAFKTVAETLRDKSFAEVIGNAELAAEHGASVPGVVLFKQFDEKKNVFSGDYATLAEFVNINSVPLIDEIGPANYKAYVESQLPLAYIFVDTSISRQRETFVDKLSPIAKQYKGKINFVWIDATKFARHAGSLGLSGSSFPAFALEDLESGDHYAFDEKAEITEEAIQAFVAKFVAKELAPTIKSEEIPADNNGPVKIIVAKNFEEIVYDSTKDVLVEFYAPWCGHCKKLAPIYDELGTAFAGTNVVIAKVDATANDVPKKMGVRGFPTLKFFPANNKETPIEYNGDRSLADLTTFIKTHAATNPEVKAAGAEKDEL